jgi:release factor glutamine methyltransferase
MMRIADALELARESRVDRLDAQWLLAHRLKRPRAWLLAHDDSVLDAADEAAFRAGIAERAGGVPLAYVTGEREFCGLVLQVSPAVLVPRPETEGLVEWALQWLDGEAARRPAPAVADLGTGSGAIALALKQRCPRAALTATDASPAALTVAAANGQQLGIEVEWRLGDWWQAVAGGRFDLVVANPPYVAGDDPHLAALRHEPLGALTPGGDGLDALRRIVGGAAAHLQPGGALLLEHGHDQGATVRGLLQAAGFTGVSTRDDLAGMARCTGGISAG